MSGLPRADEPIADHDLRFYVRHYRTLGPIFEASVSGRSVVVLAGPEANAFMGQAGGDVLGHHVFWQDFDRDRAGEPVVRGGAPNRQRRAVLSRGYSWARTRQRVPDLVAMTRCALDGWEPGGRVLFYPWVQRLVADQLGELLTHHRPGARFADLVTFMHANMATLTGTGSRDALRSAEYRGAREGVLALAREVVDTHRGPPDGRHADLVDDVVAAAARFGYELSEEQLAHVVLGPFLAGLDTVSTMASYLLHALLTHPDALARVRSELDAAGPTWPHLHAMRALPAAAAETLRLWPLAIGHDCEATAAFPFAGQVVEAGRRVFVAMAVPHFLPELYPEPERFDIDRPAHRRRGVYAPFGLGDRACLGAGIAQTQLTVIVGMALSRFVLELDPAGSSLPPYAASPNAVMRTLGVRVVGVR